MNVPLNLYFCSVIQRFLNKKNPIINGYWAEHLVPRALPPPWAEHLVPRALPPPLGGALSPQGSRKKTI